MIKINHSKLVVSILVVTSVTFLAYFDKLPSETAAAIITAVLGYIFGNAKHLIEERGKGKS